MFKELVMYWLFSILLMANTIFYKPGFTLRPKKVNFSNGELNNV